MPEEGISTFNEQMVGVQGEHIVVMNPKNRMTKQQALVHAAWLVALADDTGELFDQIRTDVNNI